MNTRKIQTVTMKFMELGKVVAPLLLITALFATTWAFFIYYIGKIL
jgi:hypothetical protein